MTGRRRFHSSVAGAPIEHSLTPILSRLVDAHLRQATGLSFISRTSRFETTLIHDLLGRVLLDRLDNQSEVCSSEVIALIDEVTTDIEDGLDFPGLDEVQPNWPEPAESCFGDDEVLWVSITSPLKHGLTSRSGVIPVDASLDIASTNQLRWDGHQLVTGSTDGAGVVLVARAWGIFRRSKSPIMILHGGGAAARSTAAAWAENGGRILSTTGDGRRPLDPRGPWGDALIDGVPDASLESIFQVDFDSSKGSSISPNLPDSNVRLVASYGIGGSVEPTQSTSGALILDGRWMLAAQHLIAWAQFIAPEHRDLLPSLPLLLNRLSEVEARVE
ncbi:MAG: hypothetical protein ACJZ59_01620 [Candidatus Thalassarchaeaceae archaeon]